MSTAELGGAESWIFDLDNTLYPAECKVFNQIDARMGAFIGQLFDVDAVEARTIQKQYFVEYGTTLRGLMERHGIEPQTFLDFVHDIDLGVIAPAPRLKRALEKIGGRKYVFTNGDLAHAERVLARLGLSQSIDAVFDIRDADYCPKPQPAPYKIMVEKFDIDPARAVMVEDIARNLVPAAEMGMTTAWIKTDYPWGQVEGDATHVHHIVDDLADWLAEVAGAD